MKLTRTEVLTKWARDWAKLKTWGQDLSRVEVEISDMAYPRRLGTCWPMEERIAIYLGPSIAVELDTVIHEFAHAAAITGEHDERWQSFYALAIHEVTGIPIPHSAANYRVLCEAGTMAVESWWVKSGHDFLWRLTR